MKRCCSSSFQSKGESNHVMRKQFAKAMKTQNQTITQNDSIDEECSISNKMLKMQLTNYRRTRGLSQKQLSSISGLSESCISSIETNTDISPTLRSLMRYATALGLEIYIRPSNYKEQTGDISSSKEPNFVEK